VTSTVRRWPLAVIAAPAAVSIWSGWVGLGGMCGFGEVQPLPGIVPLHLNTALTLPLEIESYAALALGAWLRPGTKGKARRFARWSALGALTLGMLGQVSYHLLAARHATRAPDIVVVLVACLPVVVRGSAVALLHLLAAAEADPGLSENRSAVLTDAAAHTGPQTDPRTASQTGAQNGDPTGSAEDSGQVRTAAPGPVRKPGANRSGTRTPNRTAKRATAQDAEQEFAAEIAVGEVPTLYQIRARLHVGNDRAKVLRQHIARQALTT
jgi:hypothetical protein